jgi:hypothetical protein
LYDKYKFIKAMLPLKDASRKYVEDVGDTS